MIPALLLAAIVGAPPDAATATAALGRHTLVPALRGRPALLLAPRDVPRAAMYVRFAVGSNDDGMQPGITHLSQHVLLSANQVASASALLEALYAAGAELRIDAGPLTATYALEGPAGGFDRVAALLLRMLLAPRPSASAFEQARRRALQDTSGLGPSELATMFAQATMPERGFAKDPLGDRDIVRELQLDQVQDFLQTHFRPANATIAIAGRFDVRRLKAQALAYAGGARRPRVTPQRGLAGLHQLRAPVEFHMVGLPVPLGTARQAAEARLAALVLHERVLRRFRQLGTAYSSFSVPMRRPWLSFVLVTLPIYGAAPGAVEEELRRQITAVSSPEGLSDADFGRYRRYLLLQLRAADLDPAAVASELVAGAGEVPWYGEDVTAALLELDAATFRAHVAPWAQPNEAAHVLLSPNPAGGARR